MEAAEAKPTFPFNFLRLPPAPPTVFERQGNVWFCGARGTSAPEAQNHHAIRAY
jgi:hypothetical protein